MLGSLHIGLSSPAAPPFVPTDIAGCKLWLRGDLGITQSGGNVTAWADQSGNGLNCVPGGAGIVPFVASSINGQPGIRCTGNTSGPTPAAGMVNTTSAPLAAGSPRTIFIVFKGANEYGGCLFSNRPGTDQSAADHEVWQLGSGGSVPGFVCAGQAGNFGYQKIPVQVLTTPRIIKVSTTGAAGATPVVSINNVGQTVTVLAAAVVETGPASYSVGWAAGVPTTFGWPGEIDEAIVYDTILSAPNEAAAYAYLSARYAI